MEENTLHTPKRGRRTLLWALFGLAGVIMGTAWATGFANSTSTSPDAGASDDGANVFGQGAVEEQSASPYQDHIQAVDPIAVTFDGLWGQIADDHVVFEVDLTTAEAGTYYADIYLQNDPNDWSSFQLKWLQLDDCDADDADPVAGGYDATADFDVEYAVAPSDNEGDPKLMNITSVDSHVSFQGLASGTSYCFGVAATDGHADDSPSGTFITRPSISTGPIAPEFTAIVNKFSDS